MSTAPGAGLLEYLSDSDSSGEHDAVWGIRGDAGKEEGRSTRLKTPDMQISRGLESANKVRQVGGRLPSIAAMREYVSRPSTGASSASAVDEAQTKDPGMRSLTVKDHVNLVEGLMAENKHSEAAWRAVEGLSQHPQSNELSLLSEEATDRLRKFPRFKESLALVSLVGPTGDVVIGNKVEVVYTYKHMTPKAVFKRFAPLSRTVKEKVEKHDAKIFRNSKDRVGEVVTFAMKAAAGAALRGADAAMAAPVSESDDGSGHGDAKAGYQIAKGLPTRRPELGDGWTEQDEAILKGVYEELDGKGRLKDMVSIARERIRAELHDDLEAMFRMLRLYDDVRNLDAVNLCESHQKHNKRDKVSLFRVTHSSLLASNADDGGVCVETIMVPLADSGTIDFSESSLSEGLHEFRYMMDGSDTPAAISQPFATVKPLATIMVPAEAVPCGDPFRITYEISVTRPHSLDDWIGVYKLTGCGPEGCVLRMTVPEGNKGSIDFYHTPDFPGDYHAKYHLGGHSDAEVGTSKPFVVRLRVLARAFDGREVRLFLCSTVKDMQAERNAVVNVVIPELQRIFEDRFLTITLIPMSWGTRRRGDESHEVIDLKDLKIGLAEVEACRPFFISILGERRGDPPPPCSDDIIAKYPWLRGQKLDRYTLPGKYSSLLELEILNGFLVQPEASWHSIFYVRDPDFARRAGLQRKELAKYLPDSEIGREAVKALKEELRSLPCKYVLFEGTNMFSSSLIDHLKAAIDKEHPAQELSPARKICIGTDILVKHLVGLASEHHPSFSNMDAQVESLLEEEPVVLRGGPGSGVSSLMASVAHHHIQSLLNNPEVEWHSARREWGHGITANSYTLKGIKHFFLLQMVGHDMCVCTEAEILEQAMRISNEELSLGLTMPWHPDDLVKLVPDWLDLVGSQAKFTWMIDGIDQMLGLSPIEAIYSHDSKAKDVSDKTGRTVGQRGVAAAVETKESLADIADKEKLKLLAARNNIQTSLKRWFLPLIDKTGDMCASIRFPNLHLVFSVIDADPAEQIQLNRPLDPIFQTIFNGKRSVPKVAEMQAWSAENRKRYIQQRWDEISDGLPEESTQVALEYLLHESRPPAQSTSADQVVRDRFGNTHFIVSCVDDVLSYCEQGATADDLRERFDFLNKCETLESLLLRQLKNLRVVPGAETAFKMLFLAHVGLREMELLKLVGEKEDITGEEFKTLLHNIRHVTTRIAGLIQLRSNYRRVAWKLFKSVENRLELTTEMCDHFMSDSNVVRRAQELPTLLLRLSKTEALLEFVSSQKNMPYIGKSNLLRYYNAVGWVSEIMANMLKKSFESHFHVESLSSGRKYDLQRLMEQGQDAKSEAFPNASSEKDPVNEIARDSRIPSQHSKLPSQRRKWLQHQRYLAFCSSALDTVDFLLQLEASALESSEAILESLLKMLHQADSLAMVAERSTKFPMQSLDCIGLWVTVFFAALRALPVVGEEITSPTMRHDQRAKNQTRAVQELIFTKVKLLNQTVLRIHDDTSSAGAWSEIVAGEVLLETIPAGVRENAGRVLLSLRRLNENLSGDVLDDVPTLKLEKGRQRGPTTPNTSGI